MNESTLTDTERALGIQHSDWGWNFVFVESAVSPIVAARVAEAVDRERAAWATKVGDAWDEGWWAARDGHTGNPYRGLLAADDTEAKP